ncbi:MAG: GNAT family N-acetyltransferase [Propionibacteriaceae bacterium]|nr:GNAT family N-acetyltransferase [Propionibacteriaceae bacterium]
MTPGDAAPDRAEAAEAAAVSAAVAAGVEVVELQDAARMARASRLWAEVWGSGPGGLQMHPGLLVALAHTGNYVSGALLEGELVGAAAGFFHSPDQRSLHSHIAGVLPGHTRRGIARALKLHQAAWCLRRGVTEITWTFDPLIARNARFNLVGLGTSVLDYLEDLYGPMTDALNAGHPTDRLLVGWDLNRAVVRPPWPPAGPGGALIRHQEPRPGLARAAGWVWCTTAIPADIEDLRRTDPDRAAAWRAGQRAAFQHLLATGWQVAGFDPENGYHWLREDPHAAAGS